MNGRMKGNIARSRTRSMRDCSGYRTVLFGIGTGFLILVIAFCITGTVMGMGKGAWKSQQAEEQYYQEKEQALQEDIRGMLQEQGYRNSGVNISRVLDEEGTRTYRIAIHHKRIETLEESGREALLNQLAELDFAEGSCTVDYSFF